MDLQEIDKAAYVTHQGLFLSRHGHAMWYVQYAGNFRATHGVGSFWI